MPREDSGRTNTCVDGARGKAPAVSRRLGVFGLTSARLVGVDISESSKGLAAATEGLLESSGLSLLADVFWGID